MSETPQNFDEAADGGLCTTALFGSWVPITERMPKPGNKVIVCGHGTVTTVICWRAMARWYPGGTLDCGNWDDPPEEWWDDNGDYCSPPMDAWWESNIEGDTMYQLSHVTHWMPLPSLPNVQVEERRAARPIPPQT